MQEFVSFRSRGQTIVLVALVAVALIAFVALAVDGGNVYSIRRVAQNAADGAAVAGTWVMVEYKGSSPAADILFKVNQYAQQNGVPDTNGDPNDIINDNVLAFFVYFDGSCVPLAGGPGGCWELHGGPQVLPAGARGVHVQTHISSTTFFARAVGISTVEARARATATYNPDGGLLPIAVNEYWRGSEGHCPYDNCGDDPPYSFVRDPGQQPPFSLVSEDPEVWERNGCPDPYNNYVCQGPYDDQGENFGRAFAILGGDAKPNYGSMDPRSGVMLDCRYDALVGGGSWHMLLASDQWEDNTSCPSQGDAKDRMAQVIRDGGYRKVPLPRSAFEPPIALDHIGDWSYCWASPNGEETCFNYPATDRPRGYDSLMFLKGTSASFLASEMYDNGNYQKGRYAPGEHIVIMAYNSYPADGFGEETAVVVGYFGATIVGYGSGMHRCDEGVPGNWQSFVPCLKTTGQRNTAYGIATNDTPLTLDPTRLLQEFLPKKITLIKGLMDQ